MNTLRLHGCARFNEDFRLLLVVKLGTIKKKNVKGNCFKFILGNFHPPFGPGSTYREVISRRTFLRNLKFKSERNHAHTGRRPYGVLRV